MSTSSPKRASSPEDKAQKKALILASALSFLQTKPYDRITMSEIALHAKIAKGTLFNYFATKEELFLRLLFDYYEILFQEFNKELDALRPNSQNALPFFQNYLDRFDMHTPYLGLVAILHTQLLPYVDKDVAVLYKERFEEFIVTTSRTMAERFSEFNQEKAAAFLRTLPILLIGCLHYCDPLERIEQLQPMLACYLNSFANHSPSINQEKRDLDHWLL